jgi:putative hydrolase of the HAD superfamily
VLSQAQLIVFDLGGVLASLGRPAEQMDLGMSDRDFWSVWLGSDTVVALETGAIAEAEFFERFPAELGLTDSCRKFQQRFHRWQLELFPGVVEMLQELGETHDVALLSNTNSIHWNLIDPDGQIRQLFNHVFLSFEIGHLKPYRDIFEHVLQFVPNARDEIVFLDDTEKNVAAAEELGIRSLQVTGLEGIRRALQLGG